MTFSSKASALSHIEDLLGSEGSKEFAEYFYNFCELDWTTMSKDSDSWFQNGGDFYDNLAMAEASFKK
jgi:hypothetical protein